MSAFNFLLSANELRIKKVISDAINNDLSIKSHIIKLGEFFFAIISTDEDGVSEFKKLTSDSFKINIYMKVNILPDSFEDTGILINYDSEIKKIIVDVPLLSAQFLFFTRIDDDLLIIHNHNTSYFQQKYDVDKKALFSLLQFCTIFPTNSIWKNVSRFKPGTKSSIGDRLNVKTEINNSARKIKNIISHNGSIEDLYEEFNQIFDEYLIRKIPDRAPLLTFSGGVDSSYIASRVAKLGWKDALLVNYSFGEDDEETPIAKEIAKELGLKLHIVKYDVDKVVSCVDHYQDWYYYPFVDISTLPSAHLIQEAKEKFPEYKYYIDGTGADSIVGNYKKLNQWEGIYKFPLFFRKIGEKLFEKLKYYKKDSSLELYFRLLRRSVQYGVLNTSILCRNTFNKLAYNFDDEIIKGVLDDIKFYTNEVFSDKLEIKYSQLATLHSSANIAVQKYYSLLFNTSAKILFPFFDEKIISYAYNHLDVLATNITKQLLKAPLSQMVERDLVYRPKSGFVPPMNDILRHPEMIKRLRKDIYSLDAQILRHINLSFNDEIIEVLESGKDLPYQTVNYLWSILFLIVWLPKNSHPSLTIF